MPIDTIADRFAANVEGRAYPPTIICNPGGGYCQCRQAAIVWYVEGDVKTALCPVHLQTLIASLESTAGQLALEAAQERALAAKLRATYRYAVALGMT